ncbi:MAG: hypothetical protein ACI4OH_05200 [Mitsuokella sp.]|uniref:hypothetical protein n=1 Tax=Mitsuokella sp. TaxID=2049034 RepID=UPI003F127366
MPSSFLLRSQKRPRKKKIVFIGTSCGGAYQVRVGKETVRYDFLIPNEEDAKYDFPYDIWQEEDVGGYDFSLGDTLFHRPGKEDLIRPNAIPYEEVFELEAKKELQGYLKSYLPSSTIKTASAKFNAGYKNATGKVVTA